MKRIILVVFIVSVFLTTVSAHSGSASDIGLDINSNDTVGNEAVGWTGKLYAHTNGIKITYCFDKTATDEIKSLFRAGARKWAAHSILTEESGGVVTVGIETSGKESYVAVTKTSTATIDSNGHYVKVAILFNINYLPSTAKYTYVATAVTAAHEIGHVFGLKDLKNSGNENKLMYGTGDVRTATVPTSADLNGFRVITGQHTTHTWTEHGVYATCNVCDGRHTHSVLSWKDAGSYDHTGTCRLCGKTVSQPHSEQWSVVQSRCLACGHTGAIVAGEDPKPVVE